MTPDRPLLGIVLMLGFCLLVPLSDAMAKILGATLALPVIILARFVVQGAILAAVMALTGTRLVVRRDIWGWIVLRTLLFIAGMGLMFAALRAMPLADAVAIAFVMPFILLIFSSLLGEEVGPARWSACAIGFLGTLMVIRPNFAEVGAAALLPLGVALVFALFMLATRRISREIEPVPLQAVTGVLGAAILLPAAVLMVPAAEIVAPLSDPRLLGMLAVMGLFGTLAHLCMTGALKFAPAATLAPMQYLEIPFATLTGWIVFRDLPDGLAAAGICVTVGAGLYIIWREERLSRERKSTGAAARPAPGPAPRSAPAPTAPPRSRR